MNNLALIILTLNKIKHRNTKKNGNAKSVEETGMNFPVLFWVAPDKRRFESVCWHKNDHIAVSKQ